MTERLVGAVTHYFNGPGVAVVEVTEGPLHVGDKLHFLGHTTDFTETVTSMEVDHKKVDEATPTEEIAIQVIERTRPHDQVFKIG